LFNPATGNLLLDVRYGSGGSSAFTFFDADYSNSGVVGRAYGDSQSAYSDHVGLVTRFDAAVVTTPEPGSLKLVASGLVRLFGVAVAKRRKRSRVG